MRKSQPREEQADWKPRAKYIGQEDALVAFDSVANERNNSNFLKHERNSVGSGVEEMPAQS